MLENLLSFFFFFALRQKNVLYVKILMVDNHGKRHALFLLWINQASAQWNNSLLEEEHCEMAQKATGWREEENNTVFSGLNFRPKLRGTYFWMDVEVSVSFKVSLLVLGVVEQEAVFDNEESIQ